MRVDGIDSANAGVDEQESRPPAFQIIILVREHKFSNIRSNKCLGILPATSL